MAESAEDWQALRLLTTAAGLRQLADQGIAREVPLFGKLQVHTSAGCLARRNAYCRCGLLACWAHRH